MNCKGFTGFAGTHKKGVIEKRTKVFFLTDETFTLPATTAELETAVLGGHAVALYNVYNVEDNNTEATLFEEDDFTMETASAIKKVKADMHLSLCESKALRSIDVRKFTRLIEVTENNELIVVVEGNDMKGQKITSIIFGLRQRTSKDKASTTTVDITYEDARYVENNGGIYIPDYNFLMTVPRVSVLSYVVDKDGTGNANGVIVDRMCDCLTQNEFETLFGGLIAVKNDGTEVVADENGSGFTHTDTKSTMTFDSIANVEKFKLASPAVVNGVNYGISL